LKVRIFCCLFSYSLKISLQKMKDNRVKKIGKKKLKSKPIKFKWPYIILNKIIISIEHIIQYRVYKPNQSECIWIKIKDDEETIERCLYMENIRIILSMFYLIKMRESRKNEREETKIQTKLRNLSSSNDFILF
jgi:hypothetical protein